MCSQDIFFLDHRKHCGSHQAGVYRNAHETKCDHGFVLARPQEGHDRDGKQVREVLYIDDLVELFKRFIDKYDSEGSQVFCIGGGRNNTLSILELFVNLEVGLGKKIGREFFPRRKGDQKIYVSDITKAEEVLDWKPKIGVKDGIKKIIEHVKTAVKVNGKG